MVTEVVRLLANIFVRLPDGGLAAVSISKKLVLFLNSVQRVKHVKLIGCSIALVRKLRATLICSTNIIDNKRKRYS